jgi:hypothetical protein
VGREAKAEGEAWEVGSGRRRREAKPGREAWEVALRGRALVQLTPRRVVYSGLESRCFMLDAGLAFLAATSIRRIEKAVSHASGLKPDKSDLSVRGLAALRPNRQPSLLHHPSPPPSTATRDSRLEPSTRQSSPSE